MQGMASDAELDRLRALVGSERDRLFLQLMIRHHQGALPMAEFAAAHAETPAVRSFAARVVYEQGLEIVRSEEHTSELQSLMRISYAVFCLKKKKKKIYKLQ